MVEVGKEPRLEYMLCACLGVFDEASVLVERVLYGECAYESVLWFAADVTVLRKGDDGKVAKWCKLGGEGEGMVATSLQREQSRSRGRLLVRFRLCVCPILGGWCR